MDVIRYTNRCLGGFHVTEECRGLYGPLPETSYKLSNLDHSASYALALQTFLEAVATDVQ